MRNLFISSVCVAAAISVPNTAFADKETTLATPPRSG